MREIKFRIFTKMQFVNQDNKFIYSDEFNAYDDYKLCLAAFFNYLIDQEIECFNELQLYTGLKDKNGNEIYEGDIVKFTIGPKGCETEMISKIVFEKGCYYIKLKKPSYIFLLNGYYDTCEIIGNIHETPELLNEK